MCLYFCFGYCFYMKEKRMKFKKLILTFCLILFLGMTGSIMIEQKILLKYIELIIFLFLFLIGFCGLNFWISLRIRWIIIIWLIIYASSLFLFIICSVGYHYWNWKSPFEKHILPTLSPMVFLILYLLNRIAENKPKSALKNKL